jgi:hypothetical protein
MTFLVPGNTDTSCYQLPMDLSDLSGCNSPPPGSNHRVESAIMYVKRGVAYLRYASMYLD